MFSPLERKINTKKNDTKNYTVGGVELINVSTVYPTKK